MKVYNSGKKEWISELFSAKYKDFSELKNLFSAIFKQNSAWILKHWTMWAMNLWLKFKILEPHSGNKYQY